MKQHLDLKTLKLCHLEKVKQFSKHFHLIFFSNWNSSKPTFSHKIVLSQTIGIFWGTMLLGGSPCQPKGLLFAFCHQLPPSAVLSDLGNTPWPQLRRSGQSKSNTRPGYAHPQGSLHTSLSQCFICILYLCFITQNTVTRQRSKERSPTNLQIPNACLHLEGIYWQMTVKQESCTARTSLQLQKVLPWLWAELDRAWHAAASALTPC